MKAVEKSKPVRGRPRNKDADTQILKAALQLVEKIGFKAVSMEGIAAAAGVARTTIYRRWPNKAAVVMDAFLAEIGPDVSFPEADSALESIRLQMRLLAGAFRGRLGLLIRSLWAEAQFDPELERAFRDQWLEKRRDVARKVIRQGILTGEIAPECDPDILLDALYGGLYYRLLLGSGALTDKYVDALWKLIVGRHPETKLVGMRQGRKTVRSSRAQ